MDIFTNNSMNYIVITDYFSDYFEFEKLSDMSARAVIEICKRCFAKLGIPEIVHSDKGPPFSAREFAVFSNEWEFLHTTSSPYHSQSNGKAKSSVKLAKRNEL
ncbi:MAG: transposase family protein [Chromatiales bacterium]